MRRPTLVSGTAAAVALLVGVVLAGCSSSSPAGGGTTARSGASTSPSGSSPAASASASSATSPSSTPPPSAAGTTHDPLTGGRTALTLAAGFLGDLTARSITPGVVGDATLTGTTLDLGVAGGRLVVTGSSVSGKISHTGGGLSLSSGSTTIRLTGFIVDENRHVITTTVSVNGKTTVHYAGVLDLGARTGRVTGTSDGVSITGQTVRISTTGAALFSKVFDRTTIKAGVLVGSLTVSATG